MSGKASSAGGEGTLASRRLPVQSRLHCKAGVKPGLEGRPQGPVRAAAWRSMQGPSGFGPSEGRGVAWHERTCSWIESTLAPCLPMR